MLEKGKPKTGGRKPGVKNKLTKNVKETFLDAFTRMQREKHFNLFRWGKNNPTEFYKLCSKLIPTEMSAVLKGEDLYKIYEGVDKSKM